MPLPSQVARHKLPGNWGAMLVRDLDSGGGTIFAKRTVFSGESLVERVEQAERGMAGDRIIGNIPKRGNPNNRGAALFDPLDETGHRFAADDQVVDKQDAAVVYELFELGRNCRLAVAGSGVK